jgi:hypothetical protein
MVPLLQGPLVNPHATLVTLFMNAVDENITEKDQMSSISANSPATKRLVKYLPPKGMPANPYDPEIIKISLARDNVVTYDHIFAR